MANYGGEASGPRHSPHSQREQAAYARGGTSALYEGQKAFALEEMRRYGIHPPPGVDPVQWYQDVGSHLIYRAQHPDLYRDKPPAMTAGPPGSAPNQHPLGTPHVSGPPATEGKPPMPPAPHGTLPEPGGGNPADLAQALADVRARLAAAASGGPAQASPGELPPQVRASLAAAIAARNGGVVPPGGIDQLAGGPPAAAAGFTPHQTGGPPLPPVTLDQSFGPSVSDTGHGSLGGPTHAAFPPAQAARNHFALALLASALALHRRGG